MMDDVFPATIANEPGLAEEVVDRVPIVSMGEPKLLTMPSASGAFENCASVHVTAWPIDRDRRSLFETRSRHLPRLGCPNENTEQGGKDKENSPAHRERRPQFRFRCPQPATEPPEYAIVRSGWGGRHR